MASPSYPGTALPIGYIEKQAGWVGDYGPEGERKIINSCIEATMRENPGYRVYSERIDRALDGGGVPHSTAYIGFVPIHTPAEPLDPRNLNNAPLSQPEAAPSYELPLGTRERKF